MADGTETGAAAQQAGIPQLDLGAFPNQLFWLVVFLVILFLIVSRVVLPRIGGIIDDREKSVRNDLEEAGRLDEQAAELNRETAARLGKAKSDADAILAEARARAREMQDRAVAEAAETIAARSAEAESRIDAIKDSARESVREIAASAAVEIVNRIIPGHDVGGSVRNAVDIRLNGAKH